MRHHVRWWRSKGLLQTTVSNLVCLKMENSLVINCDGIHTYKEHFQKSWTLGNFGRTWGNKKFSFKTWIRGQDLSSRTLTGVFPFLIGNSIKRIAEIFSSGVIDIEWEEVELYHLFSGKVEKKNGLNIRSRQNTSQWISPSSHHDRLSRKASYAG